MIFRRFALAIGLLFAAIASQLPEYTQQYRQRLGGAIDELSAAIARFDTEASQQGLNRDAAVSRLKGNSDVLAQQRGTDIDDTVVRRNRLEAQRQAFGTAGPVSQYAVLAENLDPGLARAAYGDYQPAIPVTTGGFVAGAIGLVVGWVLVHVLGWPVRRRRLAPEPRQPAQSWR